MSLSGSQLTGIGPIQVTHAYAGFVAKEERAGEQEIGAIRFRLDTRRISFDLDTRAIRFTLDQ